MKIITILAYLCLIQDIIICLSKKYRKYVIDYLTKLNQLK